MSSNNERHGQLMKSSDQAEHHNNNSTCVRFSRSFNLFWCNCVGCVSMWVGTMLYTTDPPLLCHTFIHTQKLSALFYFIHVFKLFFFFFCRNDKISTEVDQWHNLLRNPRQELERPCKVGRWTCLMIISSFL